MFSKWAGPPSPNMGVAMLQEVSCCLFMACQCPDLTTNDVPMDEPKVLRLYKPDFNRRYVTSRKSTRDQIPFNASS